MSGTPHLEDLQKTLEEAGRQVSQELQEADRLRVDPETTIRQREQILFEALENAKTFYKKKEYARAFIEWERACSVLGNDEFRAKVRALKESHENLARANRELAETKQALNQRVAPPPAESKFVDGSHETVNAQVKNVYSYLSQQLRTERTPRAVSFLWPSALALVILAGGFLGLKAYHSRLAGQAVAAPVQAASETPSLPAGEAGAVEDAFLQAQGAAMERQVAALKADHQRELEDARRKSAESAKNDREKVVQLQTGLKEAESRNSELERQIQLLTEENLSKDRTIASLT